MLGPKHQSFRGERDEFQVLWNKSLERVTLIFAENLLTISGTEALTSWIVKFEKNPSPRSFWPISKVYKAFGKYSLLGIKLANNPPMYAKDQKLSNEILLQILMIPIEINFHRKINVIKDGT